jgi:hypothetical protein
VVSPAAGRAARNQHTITRPTGRRGKQMQAMRQAHDGRSLRRHCRPPSRHPLLPLPLHDGSPGSRRGCRFGARHACALPILPHPTEPPPCNRSGCSSPHSSLPSWACASSSPASTTRPPRSCSAVA